MHRLITLALAAALAAAVLLGGLATHMPPADAATPPPYPVSYNFLQNSIKTGLSLSAPGLNDWSCHPSVTHPRPVVLVHGTGGNQASNWLTYSTLLANHGYCVYGLTYGEAPELAASPYHVGGMADIVASAGQLKKFVAKVLRTTGATKVDLIGHSQGTLMPNYWVRFLSGARYVKNYVSLASLWHGEGFDQFGTLRAMTGANGFDSATATPVCSACTQMSNGSAFMQKMRTGRIAVAGVYYTNIVTRFDDVVIPYTSGIQTGYPNMKNVVLQDVCANDFSDHLEIASSSNAAQVVLNTLDPKHGKPVNCRLTLPVNGFVM